MTSPQATQCLRIIESHEAVSAESGRRSAFVEIVRDDQGRDHINDHVSEADEAELLDESYWQVLLSESGHDAAFMHEIWDIFQRDARMTLQNLQGLVTADTAALIEHSHRLAGLAANLACQSLHAVCAHIERLAGELQQAPSGNDDVVTTIEPAGCALT